MITLSNLLHEQNESIALDRARRWMRRSFVRYAGKDGVLDVAALAKKADDEFGIGREAADKLAQEIAKEIS